MLARKAPMQARYPGPASESSSLKDTPFDGQSIKQTGLVPEQNIVAFHSAPALVRLVQAKEAKA